MLIDGHDSQWRNRRGEDGKPFVLNIAQRTLTLTVACFCLSQQILTKHLYRFMPARFSEALNAHATNEKITLRAHLTTIRFFYEMIGNLEGWRE